MPNDNTKTPTTDTSKPAAKATSASVIPDVIEKINGAQNVLVALSSDPSVDEMATAIGLSLYLDKLGKRATAIYSGTTPNALEFLKPEDTFESSVDTLQDFIVALNKEKADHLRYKLDGDFVKIYITPYRTRISKDDLEFSYGDFNVDLVLALNVANGIDLDSALREHGRIMHDATIINITTGNPGKFGEIEWSDKSASSISEMIAKLLYEIAKDVPLEKDEATALLTGIVAATNRFSNTKTTPETMQLSSRLMQSGANQQLISKNITPDVENKILNSTSTSSEEPNENSSSLDANHKETADGATPESAPESSAIANTPEEPTPEPSDPTKLDIKHEKNEPASRESISDEPELKEPVSDNSAPKEPAPETTPDNSLEPSPASSAETPQDSTPEPLPELPEDLKAAAASLSEAGAEAVPEPVVSPVNINDDAALDLSLEPQPLEGNPSEKVIAPPTDFVAAPLSSADPNKYGQMLEDALKGVGIYDQPEVPTAPSGYQPEPPAPQPAVFNQNPATINTPPVPQNPEINGVPSINYMPMPGEEVLPPPPTPPINMGADPTQPTIPMQPIASASPTPTIEPTPLGSQPAMQDQVYNPQASDPGAFKIPGSTVA